MDGNVFDDLANNYLAQKKAKKNRIAPYQPLSKTTGDKNLDSYYDQFGKELDVDPNLLYSQGFQESGFKNNAVSSKGAKGIAQFVPGTAEEFNVDVNDPKSSIKGQARLMRQLLDRTGDVELALAGYNFGHHANIDSLRRARQNVSETKNYVDRITKNYNGFSGNIFDNLANDYLNNKPVQTNVSRPGETGSVFDALATIFLDKKQAPGQTMQEAGEVDNSAPTPDANQQTGQLQSSGISDVQKMLEQDLADAQKSGDKAKIKTVRNSLAALKKNQPIQPAGQPATTGAVPPAANIQNIRPGAADRLFVPLTPGPTNPGNADVQVGVDEKSLKPVYTKRDLSKLDKYYPFEETEKTENGLEYLGTIGGKYRFKNADGDELELDETDKKFRPVSPFTKTVTSTNNSVLTRADDQSNLKQEGVKRYLDDKGAKFIVAADGKISQENPKVVLGEGEAQLTQSENQAGVPAGKIRVQNKKGETYFAAQKKDKTFSIIPENPAAKKISGMKTRVLSDVVIGDDEEIAPNQQSYEFQKTGKLKLSNNQVLDYVPDRTNLKDGEYRFKDEKGETYIINPETGEKRDESAAEVADQIQVKLIPYGERYNTPPDAAKQILAQTVADNLSKKYNIPFSDITEFYRINGFTDYKTGRKLPDERLYSKKEDSFGETLASNITSLKNTDTVNITRGALNELRDFSTKRRELLEAQALETLASGREFTKAELEDLQRNNVDLDELSKRRYDDYQMALTKRDVAKKDYDHYLQEELSSNNNDKYLAGLNAAARAGWIPKDKAKTEIDAYNDLRRERKSSIASASSIKQSNSAYSQAKVGTIAFNPDEQVVADYLNNVIETYGSVTERNRRKRREELDEIARQNAVAQMPWGEYLKKSATDIPLNLVKSAVSTGISSTFKGIGLAAKTIDQGVDSVFGTHIARKKVSDYGTYQLGDNIDKYLNEYLPTDKNLQGEYIQGKIPSVLGSSVGMLFGGLSKTPRLAIAVLSSLQMGGSAYDQAKSFGASEEKAQLAALLEGSLGVTEIAGIGEAIARLNKGGGASVWRKLFHAAYEEGRKEVPEEMVQEGFQTIASNIIDRTVYDPDRKWDKGVAESLALAGVSASLFSPAVTTLNTLRNRHYIKRAIETEQKNGVIIQAFGDNEVYAFGQKVNVTNKIKPLVDSYNNSRNGIAEIQEEIKLAGKQYESAKSDREKNILLQKTWSLKNELTSLQKRQVVISNEIVEKSGVTPPSETVGGVVSTNTENSKTGETQTQAPIAEAKVTNPAKIRPQVGQRVDVPGKGTGTITKDFGKNSFLIKYDNGTISSAFRNKITVIDEQSGNSITNLNPVKNQESETAPQINIPIDSKTVLPSNAETGQSPGQSENQIKEFKDKPETTPNNTERKKYSSTFLDPNFAENKSQIVEEQSPQQSTGTENINLSTPNGIIEAQKPKRNYRAGTNDATITFDSETQRDLYDLAAKEKYRMRGGQNSTSDRAVGDIEALRTKLINGGIKEADLTRLSQDTYNDVREQMKGVKHLEERTVNDNVIPKVESQESKVNQDEELLKSIIPPLNPQQRSIAREIRKLVKSDVDTSERSEKVIIRELTFAERKIIEAISGNVLQVGESYRFTLDKSAVNNIRKQGRIGENELKVTDKDLELLPLVLDKPDDIIDKGKNKMGLHSFEFIKRINGHIVVVEEARTGRKEFATISLRKFDRGSEALSHLPSLHTPEAALPRETDNKTISNDSQENDELLKRAYSEEDEQSLIEAAYKPTHELLPKVESRVVGSNLELSPEASEMIRRAVAEARGNENESSFGGAMLKPENIRQITETVSNTINQAEKAGYSDAQLKLLRDLVENIKSVAGKNENTAAAYVFDEDLPEEVFHQEDYLAGSTDEQGAGDVKKSEFWEASRTGKFNRDYGHLSEKGQISELVAKLATGQFEKYGFDKIDNFAEKANDVLIKWAEGILRRNPDLDLNKFERIARYADTEKNNREGNRTENGERDGSTGLTESSGNSKTNEEQKAKTRETEPDEGESGEIERRAAFSPIDGTGVYYDPDTNTENRTRYKPAAGSEGTSASAAGNASDSGEGSAYSKNNPGIKAGNTPVKVGDKVRYFDENENRVRTGIIENDRGEGKNGGRNLLLRFDDKRARGYNNRYVAPGEVETISNTGRQTPGRSEVVKPAGLENTPVKNNPEIIKTDGHLIVKNGERIAGVFPDSISGNRKAGELFNEIADKGPSQTNFITRTMAKLALDGQTLLNRLTGRERGQASRIRFTLNHLLSTNASDDTLVKGAKTEIKDDILYVNPHAAILLRKAFISTDRLIDKGNFFGAYLESYIIDEALDYLEKELIPKASGENRAKAREFVETIRKAADNEYKDLTLIVNHPQVPEGLKTVVQEEKAHRADFRSRNFTDQDIAPFKELDGYNKAVENVRESGYSEISEQALHYEVIAKIFVDNADELLGISWGEIYQIRDLYSDRLKSAGIGYSVIKKEFGNISTQADNFIEDYERRIIKRTQTDLEQDGGFGENESSIGNGDSGEIRKRGLADRQAVNAADTSQQPGLQQENPLSTDRSGDEETKPVKKDGKIHFAFTGSSEFNNPRHNSAENTGVESGKGNIVKLNIIPADPAPKIRPTGKPGASRSADHPHSRRQDLIEQAHLHADLLNTLQQDFNPDSLNRVIISPNGRMNEEASVLMAHVHQRVWGGRTEIFHGVFLNPHNVKRVRAALVDILGSPSGPSGKIHVRRILRQFDKAIKPNGGMIQIAASKRVQNGLRRAWQEETLHEFDYFEGGRHKVAQEAILADEVGNEAVDYMQKKGAYKGESRKVIAREVAAKIWVDGNDETGLSSEKKEYLQTLVYNAWRDSGKAEYEIIDFIESVSETGKQYADKRRSSNERNQRNSGETNARRASEYGSENQRVRERTSEERQRSSEIHRKDLVGESGQVQDLESFQKPENTDPAKADESTFEEKKDPLLYSKVKPDFEKEVETTSTAGRQTPGGSEVVKPSGLENTPVKNNPEIIKTDGHLIVKNSERIAGVFPDSISGNRKAGELFDELQNTARRVNTEEPEKFNARSESPQNEPVRENIPESAPPTAPLLKIIRTPEDSERIKQLDGADIDTLLPSLDVDIKPDGATIELKNLETYEFFRRIVEIYEGKKGEHFGGVYADAQQTKGLLAHINSLLDFIGNPNYKYPANDIERVRNFRDALQTAAENSAKKYGKHGVKVFLFDDALAEEDWHYQSDMQAAQEGIENRVPKETNEKISNYEIFQNADKFHEAYKSASKPSKVEEFVAKIATFQLKSLGIDESNDSQLDQIADVMLDWVAGYKQQNPNADLSKFSEVSDYAKENIKQFIERTENTGSDLRHTGSSENTNEGAGDRQSTNQSGREKSENQGNDSSGLSGTESEGTSDLTKQRQTGNSTGETVDRLFKQSDISRLERIGGAELLKRIDFSRPSPNREGKLMRRLEKLARSNKTNEALLKQTDILLEDDYVLISEHGIEFLRRAFSHLYGINYETFDGLRIPPITVDYLIEQLENNWRQSLNTSEAREKVLEMASALRQGIDVEKGDVLVGAISPELPRGSRSMRQEERLHRFDRYVNPDDNTDLVDNEPIFDGAANYLSEGRYHDLNRAQLQREVVAKLYTDTAAEDLNLTNEQVQEAIKIYERHTLAHSSFSIETIKQEFRKIAPSGREFGKDVVQNSKGSDSKGIDSGTGKSIPPETRRPQNVWAGQSGTRINK